MSGSLSVLQPAHMVDLSLTDLANDQARLDNLARDLSMRETYLRLKCESFMMRGITCPQSRLLAQELEQVRRQMGCVEVQKDQIMVSLGCISRRESEASSNASIDSHTSI